MRKLKLERPICFFDLETTGINVLTDKIVSISVIKVSPGSSVHESLYHLINPGIYIPDSATDIHGITMDMIKGKPYFKDVSEEISNMFEGCDIGGYNCNNFDIPLLSIELARVGITFPKIDAEFIDVCNLYKLKNPRDLKSAYKAYTGQELTDAHDAVADNSATIEIFYGMIEKHDDLPDTISEIAKVSNYNLNKVDILGKFIYNESGQYVYAFGKHKGERIGVNNVEYLGWIMNDKQDFHPNTKMWAKKIYDEIINSK